MVAAVALADTSFPFSSRNIPIPFWQHSASLSQQRLPSLHCVTRGSRMPSSRCKGSSVNWGATTSHENYGVVVPYLQIWAQLASHPFTAQGPRTHRFSPGLAHRLFDRHVARGPQQALELGHLVLLPLTTPSQR